MKRRLLSFVTVIVLVLGLFSSYIPAKAAEISTISFYANYLQSDARKMADMLNEFRASQGVYEDSQVPLKYDYDLEKVAMQRAAEIAIKFDMEHLRPDGEDYKQTLADFGFDISPRNILYGENILFGTEDSMELENAFRLLCQDEGNKKTMLGFFTNVGIGHIKIEDKTDFWVQVFSDEGRNHTYVAPLDGSQLVSVKVSSSNVDSISVDYASGDHSVAVGATVAVPSYIPKVKFVGSELDEELICAPLVFESNDGYVSASGGYMTGLSAGTGTISASLFGRTYSYNISVSGSGSVVTSVPTQAPTQAPTQVPTQTPTQTPTQVPTQTPTQTPTQVPTQTPTQVPTQTPTKTPSNTELKKGDTFTSGSLKYKVTASGKVEVTGPKTMTVTKITIPATVTYQGVKYTVTKIGDGAFNGCSKLTTATIGKNVKTIGKQAFYGCAKLKTIKFSGKKVTKIGSEAFGRIYKSAKISVPYSALKKYTNLIEKSGIGKKVSIVKK